MLADPVWWGRLDAADYGENTGHYSHWLPWGRQDDLDPAFAQQR
jgi:hypothetical protein